MARKRKGEEMNIMPVVAFGAVNIADLKIGKTYLINEKHRDPKLHGTTRKYLEVEKLPRGWQYVKFIDNKTGNVQEIEYPPLEAEGRISYLDKMA